MLANTWLKIKQVWFFHAQKVICTCGLRLQASSFTLFIWGVAHIPCNPDLIVSTCSEIFSGYVEGQYVNAWLNMKLNRHIYIYWSNFNSVLTLSIFTKMMMWKWKTGRISMRWQEHYVINAVVGSCDTITTFTIHTAAQKQADISTIINTNQTFKRFAKIFYFI
jgi:hypothetical protein